MGSSTTHGKKIPEALIFPLFWMQTRDTSYNWSVNIFNNQTHFITFNNTKLTVETAREKLISVQLKSNHDNWLTEHGCEKLYKVPEEGSELVKLLENERIDAWYTERNLADSVLKKLQNPNITYSDSIQTFKTYLATNKVTPYPYMEKLKTAMDQLRQSGKLDQIFKKYPTASIY